MTDRELMSMAKQASLNAYVPYSHFPVGAAIECDDGTVYTGCNVENAALGSTICAERTACCKAVSEGRRSFRRIAIYAGDGGALRQGGQPLCELQALGADAPHLQFLMELEKLRIFLAVAECRSFSLGAKTLYISHSTTSRAIAALEEELGVELLRRDNRVLGLTPAGELLREEAARLLRQADQAAERVREAGKKTDGSD